jgi:ADP-ribosyl-[dinitrogen reductase] hydrolase
MTPATLSTQARAALLGLAVGDALGVPVEFAPRTARQQDPVVDMRAYGTHHQPAGTWSDDSSLTFCLAETLARPGGRHGAPDLGDFARRSINWLDNAYWTAHDEVFDVGIATADAIRQLRNGKSPLESGGTAENSNGNGSLMRILPLCFHLRDQPIAERFRITSEVSGVTHAHPRSVLGCFIYLEIARQLVLGLTKEKAYSTAVQQVNEFLVASAVVSEAEILLFHRVLQITREPYDAHSLVNCQESEISSSGYVVHTFEAALWCLLRHDTYAATVLAAVNLGDDTDTTGAVAGGLAGLAYGEAAIPAEWLAVLARRADIEDLAGRLSGV